MHNLIAGAAKRWARGLAIVTLALSAPITVVAQTDEDALFGGSDGFDEFDGAGSGGLISDLVESELKIDEILLTHAEVVRLGGSFRFSSTATWMWDADGSVTDSLRADPVQDRLDLDLQARLTIDARPTTDTRFFGEFWLTHPFQGEDGASDGAQFIHVDELFSDFLIGERLFVRAGKQTLNWGVGYFYAPADLLNVGRIDPTDPEEDVEGPVSIRLNLPIGMHNLYAYAIVPEGARYASDVAMAAAYEHVYRGTEVTVGGYYRDGRAPAAMVTATRTVGDFGPFAEAVVSYGSDRTFVESAPTTPPGIQTATYTRRLFPGATVGTSYRWTSESGATNATLVAQYYFNGQGYTDQALVNRVQTPALVLLLTEGALSAADLLNPGRHYVGASAVLNLPNDVGFRVLALSNLSDGSGTIRPTASLNVGDSLGISVGLPYTWGQRGEQFTPAGSRFGLTIEVSAGALKF